MICPKCSSDDIHLLVISEFNQDTHRCQKCFHGWIERSPIPEEPTLNDILALAAKLPSGLNDAVAADKLLVERGEFVFALNVKRDYPGALTEAADAAYYAAKHLDWVARQLSAFSGEEVTVADVLRLAVVKYNLRARAGNPKDDEVEREVCQSVLNWK
jgi:hypothetical protein